MEREGLTKARVLTKGEKLMKARRLAHKREHREAICPECHGRGAVYRGWGGPGGEVEDPCLECAGYGRIWFDRRLTFAMALELANSLINVPEMLGEVEP